MKIMAVKLIFFLSFVVVTVSSAGILETLLSWNLHDIEPRASTPQSKCLCQTSGCLCCVDLNLTSTIDLGGPACLNIKQKEENVTLNLNYGDNPVHNATIKIADAANKPTCMNLLSDFAQLCAKFSSIRNQQPQGYDGCLVIEPALMRTSQATYHIGCFNFHNGVRQIQSPPAEHVPGNNENNQEEEEEEDGINADELLAVVSASAEQGIAFFSRWLGLSLNPKVNVTNTNKNIVSELTLNQESTTLPSARNARKMREHHRFTSEEKNDERFKQLLSAQDNILKESEKIGHPNAGQTTFVYTQQPIEYAHSQKVEDNNHKKNILPIVPKESRRGGKAYNIHQHVNEV